MSWNGRGSDRMGLMNDFEPFCLFTIGFFMFAMGCNDFSNNLELKGITF